MEYFVREVILSKVREVILSEGMNLSITFIETLRGSVISSNIFFFWKRGGGGGGGVSFR